MPKPKSPSVWMPSSSGPRWTIVPHIARTIAASTTRPPRAYQPAMPHMALVRLSPGLERLLRAALTRRKRHRPRPHVAVRTHGREPRAIGGERDVLHVRTL